MKQLYSAIILLAVAVVIAIFFGISFSSWQPNDIRENSVMETTQDTVEMLTENNCENSSGSWNGCGSACRSTPDSPCIDVCVKYCECVSGNQCPDGYSCGEFVDGVGICL